MRNEIRGKSKVVRPQRVKSTRTTRGASIRCDSFRETSLVQSVRNSTGVFGQFLVDSTRLKNTTLELIFMNFSNKRKTKNTNKRLLNDYYI